MLCKIWITFIDPHFPLTSVVKALMSVGGALISVALTIAALTSVVKSIDFSGTDNRRTEISGTDIVAQISMSRMPESEYISALWH